MALRKLVILAEIPDDASYAEVEAYVIDWLGCGGKGYRPPGSHSPEDDGDPMWDCIQVKSVEIMGVRDHG